MENTAPINEPTGNARFVCACPPESRDACAGEPPYGEIKGESYCVLHYPDDNDKKEQFQRAIKRKLANGDFDFRSVWFPTEQSFSRFEFRGRKVDFVDAVFNGPVRFRKAKFAKAAYFNRARFRAGANFSQVFFREGVNFTEAIFEDNVDFYYAHFISEVDFTVASFRSRVNFYGATFGDHVRFAGRENAVNITSLDLQFARIEKPDRVYFHTLTARPSWFVNVDARRFDFINVHWERRASIKSETDSLRDREVSAPHRMLAIAYRRLAINAEENHRYEEASTFRYKAMECARLQRDDRSKRFEVRALSWCYWLVSGYGERVWQALVVLMVILFVSAALYTRVGFVRWQPELGSEDDAAKVKHDDVGAPLTTFGRALIYSAAVITLQQPEPRPATTYARTVVLVETILGPLQAALLALAIRRKFMR
jgi:hypothetical protein